jgi:hypothetical protein
MNGLYGHDDRAKFHKSTSNGSKFIAREGGEYVAMKMAQRTFLIN